MTFYPPLDIAKQIALTSNIQLDYPYSADTGNVTIAAMMDVSATLPNLNIILPDSTLTGPGFALTFNNVGAIAFNVVLNDGTTLLYNAAQGTVTTIYLYDTSTANGSWRIIPFGGGTNAISSLELASSDSSIVVTSGVVSPPGGKINVSLPSIVSSITALKNQIPGFVAINQTNNSPWEVTRLIEGKNITITNQDGANGNPTFDLNDTVTISELKTGNIIINNNLITNADSNGVINIVSNGANSSLNLNSVSIDTSGNLTNVNSLSVTETFNAPNTAKAWCRFSNTSGELSILSTYNVLAVTYSAITNQYKISFTALMDNTDYAVFITCANNNSTPPLQARIGYDVIKELNSVSIVLTDSAGEMLADIPEGVSVMVFS